MRLIVNKSNYFILSLSKVSNPLFDKRNHHLAKPFEKYCSSIFRELKCLINQTNLSLSGRILFHQETHPAKVGRKLMTRPASNTVNLRSFFFFFCISRTYRVLTAFSVLCLTKEKFVRSLGLKNIYEETVG